MNGIIFGIVLFVWLSGYTTCVFTYANKGIPPNCTRILLTLIPIVNWIVAIRMQVKKR